MESSKISKYSNHLDDWEFVTKASARDAQFSNETETLLIKSHQDGILLEALVAEVLLINNNAGDIFVSGFAKAAHFNELGDIQTIISVLANWTARLHSKSTKLNVLGDEEGSRLKDKLNAHKIKEFDRSLRNCYNKFRSQFPNLTTSLRFHPDTFHVHQTMATTIAHIWPRRLCVYRGQKDLRYLQISVKSSVVIGERSTFRLTNQPPTFALYLDNINCDDYLPEAHVWISVDNDLATSILDTFFQITTTEVLEQHVLVPIKVEDIGFELGTLAVSNNLEKRLSLICGQSVEVVYDSYLRVLDIMCSSRDRSVLEKVLHEEINSLRRKLSEKEHQISFPDLCGPIRLQINEGFKCHGVSGFLWSPDMKPSTMQSSRPTNYSINSQIIESMMLREQQHSSGHDINDNNKTLMLIKESTDDNCKKPCIAFEETVRFQNTVTFNLIYQINLRISDIEKYSTNTNDYTRSETIASLATRDVFQILRDGGFKIDSERSDTVIVVKEVFNGNQVRLQVTFPNLYYGKAGVICLESHRSVSIEDRDQLDIDLKKFSIVVDAELYMLFEITVKSNLERFKRWKAVDDYQIDSLAHSTIETCSDENKKMYICVRVSETYHLPKISDFFSNLLRPATLIIESKDSYYLKSHDGKQFLRFLKELTSTLIHISFSQQTVSIYGSKRDFAINTLRKQLLKQPREFCWYLIDLGNPNFVSNAVKVWSDEFRSKTEQLQCSNHIRQCIVLANRAEMWLETTHICFKRYYEDIKSKLVDVDKKSNVELVNVERLVTCPVCFDKFSISEEKCYVLSACGHAYCQECLKQMVFTSAKQHQLPVKCALENCGSVLPALELRSILYTQEDQRKLASFLLEDFVVQNLSSLRMCQNQNCPGMGFYEKSSETMSCLWCRPMQWFCVFCSCKWHPDVPCGASFNILDWLQEDPTNRKKCPNCLIAIEKIDGCDCVECGYCKSFMCWKCATYHDSHSSVCHLHVRECVPKITKSQRRRRDNR